MVNIIVLNMLNIWQTLVRLYHEKGYETNITLFVLYVWKIIGMDLNRVDRMQVQKIFYCGFQGKL